MTEQRLRKHVKGRRGEEFREKIKGLKAGEIIGIAIDVSKSFYRVIIFNFNGEALSEPFEVDALKRGYRDLLSEVKRAVRQWEAKKVFWVMEPTASYNKSLC